MDPNAFRYHLAHHRYVTRWQPHDVHAKAWTNEPRPRTAIWWKRHR